MVTPLHVQAWVDALAGHQDPDLRSYITTGLTQGFRIGFDRMNELRQARRNMPSATHQAQVVEDYLRKERNAGRLIGPLPDVPDLHINRIGVVPKGHTRAGGG